MKNIAGKIADNVWPGATKEGLVEETTEHTIHSPKHARDAKDIVDNFK